MKLYNYSTHFKNTKHEIFDYDCVFIDIFDNVNFIKISYGRGNKKDIREIFEKYDIYNIQKLNKFLHEIKLAITYIDSYKRLYLYEIISLKEYEKEHKIEIIKENNDDQEKN